MTHPSPRFRILPQLTAYAACLCLAFACGGTTEGDSHGDMTDGPTTDSGPTNSGGTGGDTTTGGGNGGAVTAGGAVTTGVVSNCPSLEPAEGAGCTVDAQVCDYANCTAPDYRDAHSLACSQGAWQLLGAEVCDNVPTTCPPSVSRGEFCDLPEGSGPCSVIDACGALRNAYCTDSVWEYGNNNSQDAAPPGFGGAGTGPSAATVTTSPRPEPRCPDLQPEWGAACCPADYPAYCDYSVSGSDAGIGTGPGSEAVSATGFGATGGGAPLPLTCAACGPDMTWNSSSGCP